MRTTSTASLVLLSAQAALATTTTTKSTATTVAKSTYTPVASTKTTTASTSAKTTVLSTSTGAKCTARPTPTIVFDVPTLHIHDLDGPGTFNVKLSSQPAGPITHYFNNANLLVDRCAVTFDQNNWNTFQTVHAVTPPLYTGGGNLTSSYSVVSSTGGTVGTLPVNRYAVKGAQSNGAGDPHITNNQGVLYTYLNNTVTNYWKGQHLEVQGLLEKCQPTSGVYCNHAMAVRYGGSVYYYDSRDVNYTTGTFNIKVSHLGNNEPGFYHAVVGGTYYFYLPDGGNVYISPSAYTTAYGVYNTIGMNLSPAMLSDSTAGGLFNKFSATGNQIFGRDGKVGSALIGADLNAFFASWNVPDHENFFLKQINVNSLPDGIAYMKCTGASSPLTPPKDASVLPEYDSYWFYGVQDIPNPTSLSAEMAYIINEECSTLFTDGLAACDAILPVANYIAKCKADGALVGNSADFAQSHLEDFLVDCATRADSMALTGNYNVVGQAVSIQVAHGFGNYDCPSNCSGNGVCSSTGCTCSPGFQGVSCGTSVNVSL